MHDTEDQRMLPLRYRHAVSGQASPRPLCLLVMIGVRVDGAGRIPADR